MPRIMRVWRGETPSDRAAEYLARMTPTALADYKSTPGNLGAWVLSRSQGAITEVVTLSLWDSMSAIHAFAGAHPEKAKYYDFDPDYLVTLSPTVEHWNVHGAE